MATACFLFVTFLPELLLSLPRLYSPITFFTLPGRVTCFLILLRFTIFTVIASLTIACEGDDETEAAGEMIAGEITGGMSTPTDLAEWIKTNLSIFSYVLEIDETKGRLKRGGGRKSKTSPVRGAFGDASLTLRSILIA